MRYLGHHSRRLYSSFGSWTIVGRLIISTNVLRPRFRARRLQPCECRIVMHVLFLRRFISRVNPNVTVIRRCRQNGNDVTDLNITVGTSGGSISVLLFLPLLLAAPLWISIRRPLCPFTAPPSPGRQICHLYPNL